MSSSQQQPNNSNLAQQKQNFKRSMSVSEGLHVRLPALHHADTEPVPSSPLTHQNTNNICPSESNWANKYEDFDIGKPIGYGSSAVVYEALYKPLRKRVAVKMIDLDMFERNQIDELRRETALMALSKHPNVLRVYGSFVNGSKLYIVTPYLAAGSCLDIMKTSFQDGFDEISIATILRQALEGLVYLHKNGHIHRDVKAGNLLMDQYGTVLLADFGVSSSLNENGAIRKTFVGTPCWMAPEVMEQAGYDYKADIWSFGITALELATGHAPFAKYPPMKVLMMTLQCAPPTLDRENCKHKFSKTFKEMIDICLQKEPSKRPSAEKLLLHPFFKQAKRKDYLIKSVLANVLPLDQRPNKKIPKKSIEVSNTDEQWDFDPPSDEELQKLKKSSVTVDTSLSTPVAPPVITTVSPAISTPETSVVTTPLERSKSTVQFEDCPKPVLVDRTKLTNSPSTEHSSDQQSNKKHISFGDAVIRDPAVSRSLMSPVVESPPTANTDSSIIPAQATPTLIPASANHSPNLPNHTTATAPASTITTSKKSRFVIEDTTPASHTSPQSESTMSPPNSSPTESTSVGLGISSVVPTSTSANVPNTNSSAIAANISSNNNTLQEGEFKKGRFSVNQTPSRSLTPAMDESNPATPPEKSHHVHHSSIDFKTTPMTRNASQDSFQERKSRFEVKHTATIPTDSNVSSNTPLQSLPLTRESSSTSALSRDSSLNNKISRFSIEGPYCELPAANGGVPPECRKKGRFELTGGSNAQENAAMKTETQDHMDSPQSTVGPSPVISPYNSVSRGQAHRVIDNSLPHMIYSHMESLLKQTEMQKNMLQELFSTMPWMQLQTNNSSIGAANGTASTSNGNRGRTVSDSKKPTFLHNEELYQRAQVNTLQPSSSNSSITADINATMEHLQQLLIITLKQNDKLTRDKDKLAAENDVLKRELERLRKNQQQQGVYAAL
ncbi:MAG: hypothetical protein EXX96DRAFT_621937 [Benjaminiella poitrasii]|nr:MAG: hypothetical protein EXX96DRAFT_621937 [Benjaminiella poitrasii]